jgi:ABC-type Fe3+ transport system substrate-binding protein
VIGCEIETPYTAKDQGLPMIKGILPADGTFAIPGPLAVLKNAPAPNAALVLADWLLSPEAQSIYVSGGVLSPLDSPEVKYPEDFPSMDGVKLVSTDPIAYQSWMPEGIKAFNEIFGEYGQ